MKAKIYYKKNGGKSRKVFLRALGVLSIGSGILLLLYFFFPILSYHFFLKAAFANDATSLEVPIPKREVAKDSGDSSLIQAGVDAFTMDSTDARTWYPGVETSVKKNEISGYTLSIPAIDLKDAKVSTTDYDLSSHLVQYYGTITPPKKGTTVIYGHSTLPQLFNPKDYKTIFANLHKIEVGDEIRINVNDAEVVYKIYEKIITTPDDTSVFTQNYDSSYITLVTCTPPGTTWKRLIIKAKIEELEE